MFKYGIEDKTDDILLEEWYPYFKHLSYSHSINWMFSSDPSFDREDFVQICCEQLIKLRGKFDLSKGKTFESFVLSQLKGRVIREIGKAPKLINSQIRPTSSGRTEPCYSESLDILMESYR